MTQTPSKRTYEIAVKTAAYFIIASNIRQQIVDEADAQLTESIRQHGILQPLGVRPEGDRGKLAWGHRRFRCGMAAGLTEFPTVILSKDMTEGDFLTLQMIEN